jgi:hypothetical protein
MPAPGPQEGQHRGRVCAGIAVYSGAVPGVPAAIDPQASDPAPPAYRSFGWAGAAAADGATAAAWRQAGETYGRTSGKP